MFLISVLNIRRRFFDHVAAAVKKHLEIFLCRSDDIMQWRAKTLKR